MHHELRGINKTWSDQLHRLDTDLLRRLVRGGVPVNADGSPAGAGSPAAATIRLFPASSRLLTWTGSEDGTWAAADTELPSTITAVPTFAALQARMGDVTGPAAVVMRELLVDTGWLVWSSDRDGGYLIEPPETTWRELATAAAAQTGDG